MPPSIARILDARGAGMPRFSPDGRWLHYLTDLTGTQQLWRVPVAGGMPQRLSFECDRVGGYSQSRDGRHIAYVADSGGNEKWQVHVMHADGTNARALTARGDRIHHIVDWSPKGDAIFVMANLRHPLYFDLYRIDLAGGEPHLLVQRDGTGFGGVVLDDGSVVFTTNRGRMDKNHLEILEPDGTRRLLTPDAPIAQHNAPRRFGDTVAVLSDRDREFQGIARIGRDGGFERLVDVEADVDGFSTKGDVLGYSLNRGGVTEVHLLRAGRDEVVRGLPPAVATAGDITADGTVAVSVMSYDSPGTIYIVPPGGEARVAVPPIMAGLSAADLPAHELVRWTSFDGLEIPGFLLRRRDADRAPRPTVIQVHGGPEGQARPSWNPIAVALVARGFNVLQPNVRGSAGYGLRYQSLDDVRLRLGSVRDLDAAAAWLADSGIAPRDKIAVMGGSYGGYMTLAAIAFFPERGWAAAVDTVGIYNFRTFLERMDQWRRPLREAEYGSLEKDAEFLETIAPATQVDRIRAPLLVIHGANDPRVPVYEAEQVVSALRARKHDVTYLRYEDEGHGLQKAKNRADAWPKVVEFLSRHLSPSSPPASA